MAETEQQIDVKESKRKIKEQKKQLRQEQKKQRKEAKARAKEIALMEAQIPDESEGSGGSVFVVTTIIILVWLAILMLLIKLDVGGFGTNVMTPLLKDIPVLNQILPGKKGQDATEQGYGGYNTIQDAVNQIKVLELQLDAANAQVQSKTVTIEQLETEIKRLKTFEDNQLAFQKIKNEFYEEVIYAENGPGPEAYAKYFETIDPAAAQALYREVVQMKEESAEIKDYAAAYSEMKPKEAAKIFESMTDNLNLVARILQVMSADDRGKILGVMDPNVAAKITKIMDPKS